MAANIQALGDTIKISKAFVNGKDRITINGEQLFEGKLKSGEAEVVSAGVRDYSVVKRVTNRLAELYCIELEIHKGAKVLHSGVYDQHGRAAGSAAEAKATASASVCGMLGGIAGFTTMMVLNMTTGVVPGGAIGGGIGGGLGGAIGFAIGKALFPPRDTEGNNQ